MKSVLMALLDFVLRYVVLYVLLLCTLGIGVGLMALGVSEPVAGVVALTFLVGSAVAVVVYSRRNAARLDASEPSRAG